MFYFYIYDKTNTERVSEREREKQNREHLTTANNNYVNDYGERER